MRIRGAWIVVAVLIGGCNKVTAEPVDGFGGADAVWAADNTFCARSTHGFSCWAEGAEKVVERAPKSIPVEGKVQSLALRHARGCLVDAHGLACFSLSDD